MCFSPPISPSCPPPTLSPSLPSPPAHSPFMFLFLSSRRRHTRSLCDWSSDVCSSDLIALGAVVLLLLIVVWAVTSWFAFSSGVSDANKRLDPNAKSALTPQSGLVLSHPTTVLLLGTDNARVGGREGDRHSDSILLLRTDPSHHRL